MHRNSLVSKTTMTRALPRVLTRLLTRLLPLTLCLACSAPVLANHDEPQRSSCLIASDNGYYGAGGAMPARICLGPDEDVDLTMGQPDASRHYPVNRVEVAPGQELIVSDRPGFGGRIWRLRRSLHGAELRAQGIPRHALASARVVATACFYEHDAFDGKAQCLGPGPMHKRLARLDSSVSSIRVPPGFSVAVFRRVSGLGKAALYHTDVDAETLRRDGLHDAIRAVQVLRIHPACTKQCPVAGSDAWDLDAMHDTTPDGATGHTSVTFDLAAGRSFVVDYGGMLRLDVRNSRMIVSTGRPRRDEYQRFDARTRYLTLQITAMPGSTDLLAQLIQTDAHDVPVATHIVQEPHSAPTHTLLSVRNTAKGVLALAPLIQRLEWTMPQPQPSARH